MGVVFEATNIFFMEKANVTFTDSFYINYFILKVNSNASYVTESVSFYKTIYILFMFRET